MKTLPTVGKIISIICLCLILSVILFFTSCGSTRSVTKIQNNADGMGLTISQTTNGSTINVDLKPSVSVAIDSTNILTK